MRIPRQAIEIVKKWEGFRPTAYQDAVGIWTIGYGTTGKAGVGIVPHIGMTITERDAEFYLIQTLEKFAKQIRPAITAPMNDNEWSAFLSLAYNIGPGAFIESTALRRFNDGDKMGAAQAILWWNKAGGRVLRGLERRRRDEVELFLMDPPESRKTDWTGIMRTVWAFLRTIFGKAPT